MHGPGKPTTHKALRANDDGAGLGRGILDGDLVYVVFPLDETSSEETKMRSLVSVWQPSFGSCAHNTSAPASPCSYKSQRSISILNDIYISQNAI